MPEYVITFQKQFNNKPPNIKTMRTKTTAIAALLMLGMPLHSFADNGDSIKMRKATVAFLVSMTCENCQKRIEENISFEKGVTDLEVNLPQKTVCIEYKTDKTSPEKLKEAISKLGYTVAQLPKTNGKAATTKAADCTANKQ